MADAIEPADRIEPARAPSPKEADSIKRTRTRHKAAANVDPLWSMADIASKANVSLRLVERWRSCNELPEADLVIGRRPRWHRATVETWLRERWGEGGTS
jgi:hypothetical protein